LIQSLRFGCRDCLEYKRWKASESGESGAAEAVEALTLRDKDGNEIEKQLPGGKKKVKSKPQVSAALQDSVDNSSTYTQMHGSEAHVFMFKLRHRIQIHPGRYHDAHHSMCGAPAAMSVCRSL
jgi:hypothetical protein